MVIPAGVFVTVSIGRDMRCYEVLMDARRVGPGTGLVMAELILNGEARSANISSLSN